uniref:Uncharacterized protein n=1 Tax=Arundo donax TaxID=35708 RepID=A0A0A9GKT6_ARUDO
MTEWHEMITGHHKQTAIKLSVTDPLEI